ncbi:MAG: hypothetical protein ACK5M4_13925 [Pseudorhodobacter sp.]
MTRRLAFWLIGAVIVACYAVPYLFLGSVTTWYGSFLFWSLAGVAVIILNAAAMANFKGDAE